jgi:hypothetical protein
MKDAIGNIQLELRASDQTVATISIDAETICRLLEFAIDHAGTEKRIVIGSKIARDNANYHRVFSSRKPQRSAR